MGLFERALEEFFQSPIQASGAIAAITGLVYSAIFPKGRKFWRNVWAVVRGKPIVPSETIRAVQDANNSFWQPASDGSGPLVQIALDGFVTNLLDKPNRVVKAEIEKPWTQAEMILICNDDDARCTQILLPNESADLHIDFMLQGLKAPSGEPLRLTVWLIDQYSNRHKLKCVFKATALPTD